MSDTICVQCMPVTSAVPEVTELEHWARCALPADCSSRLTIRIVDEAEGLRLNSHWRGGTSATNVLAFPAGEAPPGMDLLGDIVICAPVAVREATAARIQSRAHWAHLVVHGVLHLLGYKHERDDDAQRMEQLETRILQDLGFPDPYRDRP